MIAANNGSVALARFAAEAGDHRTAQSMVHEIAAVLDHRGCIHAGAFDQAIHIIEISADRDGMEESLVVPAGVVYCSCIRHSHPAGRLGELADIAQNWLETGIYRRYLDTV
jgi:hypothetical protein